MSETAKYRHLIVDLLFGNGVDIGSGGDPIVPGCISMDLPPDDFSTYNGSKPNGQINYCGDARSLPFKDGTLGWVYSSHLLEDFAFEDWPAIMAEWSRVLKWGGRLIILIPDKEAWAAAVAAGQPPNCAHKHEGTVGELSQISQSLGLTVLQDERVGDYSILFTAVKN